MWGSSETGGCVAVMLLALGVFVVGAIIFTVPGALADLSNSRATELRAEATLERARSDREHQQSVDFENRFMLWTVAMQAYKLDVCWGSGAVFAALIMFGAGLGLARKAQLI